MEFDLTKPYCYYFNEICKIPHGSYHEKAISDYVVSFAKEHHLRYVQDAMWNVVIYKDAADGYRDYDSGGRFGRDPGPLALSALCYRSGCGGFGG